MNKNSIKVLKPDGTYDNIFYSKETSAYKEYFSKNKYLCVILITNNPLVSYYPVTFDLEKTKKYINLLINSLTFLLFSALYNIYYLHGYESHNRLNTANFKFYIAINK